MGVDDALAIVNKLGGASFATLLLLILWGSWKEVWTWTREITKLIERYEMLLARERDEKEWWRNIAMRATGIAEMQGVATAALAKKTSEAS